jgi:hypothetical protein
MLSHIPSKLPSVRRTWLAQTGHKVVYGAGMHLLRPIACILALGVTPQVSPQEPLKIGATQAETISELRARFDEVTNGITHPDGRVFFVAGNKRPLRFVMIWFCNGQLDQMAERYDGGFSTFAKLVAQGDQRYGNGSYFPEVNQAPDGETTSIRFFWKLPSEPLMHYVEYSESKREQALEVGDAALRGDRECT